MKGSLQKHKLLSVSNIILNNLYSVHEYFPGTILEQLINSNGKASSRSIMRQFW